MTHEKVRGLDEYHRRSSEKSHCRNHGGGTGGTVGSTDPRRKTSDVSLVVNSSIVVRHRGLQNVCEFDLVRHSTPFTRSLLPSLVSVLEKAVRFLNLNRTSIVPQYSSKFVPELYI